MLTPDYLDQAPDSFVALIQQLEDDILKDFARRIGKIGEVTDTADWQLWRLDQVAGLRADIVKRLASYSGKSEAEIRKILQDAGTRALQSDDSLYRRIGRDPKPLNQSETLLNLLNAGYRQTAGTWKNLTATTAATATGEFEAALDQAWAQVSSGAFDYDTAIRRSVNSMARSLPLITYPSGHRDSLEVAARRAILTGVNQTAARLQLSRMDEMACEFVETTAHAGARPEHVTWQGRIFHRGGAVTYDGQRYADFEDATGYGTGAGLCGWNCRHNFHPFFPGLSKPAYDSADRSDLVKPSVPYHDRMYTEYEISQMQRERERAVRRYKREYMAEKAAGVDATQSALNLKRAREQLDQFIVDTKMPPQSDRTFVPGFDRSQASKATWAARKAQQDDD